jgi:hypothetical protein
LLFVLQAEEIHQPPKETSSVPRVVDLVVNPSLPSPLKTDKKEDSLVVEGESKPANRSLFDDSDSSDGELFKTKASGTLSKAAAPLKKGGLKSNAKINSSLIDGSDESFLSNQSTIPSPKKVTTPSFLLAGSDDDGKLLKIILFPKQLHVLKALVLFLR